MKFQYKYIFANNNNFIVEVEILNLPDNTPKHKKYYWLWCNDNVKTLSFISMKDNYRKFTEGELFMDDDGAVFDGADYSVSTLVKKNESTKELDELITKSLPIFTS